MAKGILPSSLPNQRKTAWNSYIWNTCFWVLLYSSKGKVKAAATIFCIRNKCNCRLIGLCQQWWGQYISTEFTLKEKGIGIILLKNYGSKHIYVCFHNMIFHEFCSKHPKLFSGPFNHSTISASMILYSIHFLIPNLPYQILLILQSLTQCPVRPETFPDTQ